MAEEAEAVDVGVQERADFEEGEGSALSKSWTTLWSGGDTYDSDDMDSDEDDEDEDGEALSQEVVDMIAKEKALAQEDIQRMQAERRRSMMKFSGLRMKKGSLPSITRVNTTRSGQFAGFNIAKGSLQGSDRRLRVLQELVGSEQDYVQDLALIVNGFLQPLRTALPGHGQDLSVIFGNVELLLSVNKALLASLNDQVVKEDPSEVTFRVGDVFLSVSNQLMCYEQYCTNHKRAVSRLEQCLKQPAFAASLDQCRSRVVATGNLLHLTDMLIKPVQRICKYPLLIKELIKLTPTDHPDLEPLEQALILLEVTTKNINTSKGAAENMEMLRELQRNIDGFDGTLAVPGRSICLEGALQKVNPRGKVQTRQFFLLSDMLIWCKPKTMKKNHYIFKGMLRLDLAVVRDTKDDKSLKNRFQIIKLDNKKIYDICCGTQELKVKWMREIERLINVYLEIEKKNEEQRHSAMRPGSESFSDTSKDMKSRSMSRIGAVASPEREPPSSPHRTVEARPGTGEMLAAGEPIEFTKETFMDLLASHQLLASHMTRLEEKLAAGYESRAKLEVRVSQLEQRLEKKARRKASSSAACAGKEKKRKRAISKKSSPAKEVQQ